MAKKRHRRGNDWYRRQIRGSFIRELREIQEKTRATVEETLAKFVTRWKGGIPLSWKRDGNLIRKGRPNKPRPGSSAGKIGNTKVVGAKAVLKDFKLLINTLNNLGKKHGHGNVGAMRKAYKGVRTSVNATIKRA